MKILHTADFHLKQYGDNRWQALTEVIRIGKSQKIGAMVISGDLFDRDTDSEELRPKIRGLFSGGDFPIVIIPGNHDYESFRAGYHFGDDVRLISDRMKPVEMDDVCFWGLPFEPANEPEQMLEMIRNFKLLLHPEKTNLLLYHGDLLDKFYAGSETGDETDRRYMPVHLKYFRDVPFEYILAGHFHSRFWFEKLEAGGYFVYPGSPCSITRKETGVRKVNLFQTGKAPEEYPIDTFHYIPVNLEINPFDHRDPLAEIEKSLSSVHPKAGILLKVSGYFDSSEVHLSEEEICKKIGELAEKTGRCDNPVIELRDKGRIIRHSLYREFQERTETCGCMETERKEMSELVIRAMSEVV